jgi:hypothetical protein
MATEPPALPLAARFGRLGCTARLVICRETPLSAGRGQARGAKRSAASCGSSSWPQQQQPAQRALQMQRKLPARRARSCSASSRAELQAARVAGRKQQGSSAEPRRRRSASRSRQRPASAAHPHRAPRIRCGPTAGASALRAAQAPSGPTAAARQPPRWSRTNCCPTSAPAAAQRAACMGRRRSRAWGRGRAAVPPAARCRAGGCQFARRARVAWPPLLLARLLSQGRRPRGARVCRSQPGRQAEAARHLCQRRSRQAASQAARPSARRAQGQALPHTWV